MSEPTITRHAWDGDEPTGVAVATAVRATLERAGVEIVTIPELKSR